MDKTDVFDRRQGRRSEKLIKDPDRKKVESGVFEYNTLLNIQKLMSKNILDRMGGPVSTGKEADVFLAYKNGEPIVVKIYRLATSSYFKKATILQYLQGDRRFTDIKKNKTSIIFAWVQKEFKNLILASKAGLNAPKPLGVYKNVLAMSAIGGEEPAPRMIDSPPKDPLQCYESILEQLRLLYKKDLVHADLSEYNILMDGDEPYLIDFSQGVLKTHPKADFFLRRDVKNLCIFFSKLGVNADAEKAEGFIKQPDGTHHP